MAELRARGLTVTDPVSVGRARQAFLDDPSGNRVELLFNGDEVYPPLWADLQAARRLITWHVFWFKPGRLADRLHEILVERASSPSTTRLGEEIVLWSSAEFAFLELPAAFAQATATALDA